jgi:hypothetical protein
MSLEGGTLRELEIAAEIDARGMEVEIESRVSLRVTKGGRRRPRPQGVSW